VSSAPQRAARAGDAAAVVAVLDSGNPPVPGLPVLPPKAQGLVDLIPENAHAHFRVAFRAAHAEISKPLLRIATKDRCGKIRFGGLSRTGQAVDIAEVVSDAKAAQDGVQIPHGHKLELSCRCRAIRPMSLGWGAPPQ